MLCGFRANGRVGLAGLQERVIPSGNWLRARHLGPHSTRWQTWQRLQLEQLRFGRPRDAREPFEEDVTPDEAIRLGQPCCDVYFPCG